MIPFKEVNVLDRNTEALGIPTSTLMENAGKAVAEELLNKFSAEGKNVLIICGTGNNAGDGFVAARYLRDKCRVTVVLIRDRKSIRTQIAKVNFNKLWKGTAVTSYRKASLQDFDIIVDALLGIGVSGEIKEPYKSAVEDMNTSGKIVISIDVPSGLGCNVSVKPKATITFHDVKEGMTQENCGEIIVRGIGIPEEAETYTGPGEFVYYPIPKADSHKGQNGTLLIIGGGPYTGAPALAGLAAYRSGVDLVHIATPEEAHPVIASFSPEFIVHPLGPFELSHSDVKYIRKALLPLADAVLIGPGLGRSEHTKNAVREFLRGCELPVVIDADGLSAVAEDLSVLKNAKAVLTPHAGEFVRLNRGIVTDAPDERADTVRAFAAEHEITALLKGKVDVISDGKRVKWNRTGNAAMSVGGTGDVLAGIVAGLLARGVSPFNSARMGAYLCGSSGDAAFQDLGYSLMASDVIDRISRVLKEVL